LRRVAEKFDRTQRRDRASRDRITIMNFGSYSAEEAARHQPHILVLDEKIGSSDRKASSRHSKSSGNSFFFVIPSECERPHIWSPTSGPSRGPSVRAGLALSSRLGMTAETSVLPPVTAAATRLCSVVGASVRVAAGSVVAAAVSSGRSVPTSLGSFFGGFALGKSSDPSLNSMTYPSRIIQCKSDASASFVFSASATSVSGLMNFSASSLRLIRGEVLSVSKI